VELSIRAYAKHRGVSEGAVRKAIKSGRITKNENGKIVPTIADKQWQQNSDPAQVQNKPQATFENTEAPALNVGPSYQQSRAIREAYNARMAKIQFEKETGKLISADQVRIDAYNAGRVTRDRILNIPDRVIPMLVGKTNIKEMKEILKSELIKALEELSKGYGTTE